MKKTLFAALVAALFAGTLCALGADVRCDESIDWIASE